MQIVFNGFDFFSGILMNLFWHPRERNWLIFLYIKNKWY